MNKRGLINEVFIVIIMFLVFIALIGLYWIFATAGPIVVGEGKFVANQIQTGIEVGGNGTALANASRVATQTSNSILGMVELVVYVFFLGFMLGYVALCYYIKTYKWLGIIWGVLAVAVVFISAIISDAYVQSSHSADLNNFYTTWGTNDFLMTNLPYISAVFFIVSGIILFVIVATGSDETTEDIR